MTDIFLETDRLLLRKLEEADFADYAAYAVDDEMSRMMGRALLKTEADILANFNWLKDKEPRCYGIVEKASGRLIGNLTVSALPAPLAALPQLQGWQGRTLSFCICRSAQRRGYAAEAVRAVVDELFNTEQMDFVQCGCYAFNEPSRLLQEKLGFAFLTRLCVPTPQGEAETIEHILWNPRRKNTMDLNAYFKSVIDQDREAVVICDLNHTIIYMNPAAVTDYAKYGGAALLGKSLLNCHNPQSVDAIHKVLDWFAADASHNIVYTYHNENHNRDVYMVALRDADGTLIGYYEKHDSRKAETMKRYDLF